MKLQRSPIHYLQSWTKRVEKNEKVSRILPTTSFFPLPPSPGSMLNILVRESVNIEWGKLIFSKIFSKIVATKEYIILEQKGCT
jgi:hypothetical protein